MITGTTKEEEASRFYLDDKGSNRFRFLYYKGAEEREAERGYLAVQHSRLPAANTQINVAMSAQQYDEDDFTFEVKERFPHDPKPVSYTHLTLPTIYSV